jgi:membrane fusion protein (multidrug efflux system)
MMRPKITFQAACLAMLCALLAWSQGIELATVVSKPISRTIDLPGELQPFLSVALHARVSGYVERVLVDRGSKVETGQLLIELSAPEVTARIAEAEAKIRAAEADRLQSAAQLSGIESTLANLKKAAETPGAVAGNEIVQMEKQVEAARALVEARQQAVHAAEAAVQSQKDMEQYLKIRAPFDGVVTERLVHPGALAGVTNDSALLTIQQVSHLRLVAAVPEEYVGGIAYGAKVEFRVPAFPERTYAGTVARSSRSVDAKTRTMPVELDVLNSDGTLAPGMFPTIKWPVRRSTPGLFVPKASVVTTTERTFVIRDQNGRAEWVDVKKGAADGDLIEITGKLSSGDRIVRRATDEMREGAPLQAHAK